MELKQAGGLYLTHCVLAQGAQFTFPSCDQREQKMTKDWLHLVLSALPKSTAR
jgi:hypothetical protein